MVPPHDRHLLLRSSLHTFCCASRAPPMRSPTFRSPFLPPGRHGETKNPSGRRGLCIDARMWAQYPPASCQRGYKSRYIALSPRPKVDSSCGSMTMHHHTCKLPRAQLQDQASAWIVPCRPMWIDLSACDVARVGGIVEERGSREEVSGNRLEIRERRTWRRIDHSTADVTVPVSCMTCKRQPANRLKVLGHWYHQTRWHVLA